MALPESKILTADFKASKPTFRFKRQEHKYAIFNEGPIEEIIRIIHSYFPVDPFKPDIFPTIIQTTWCETPDWLSLREYLDRKQFRFKLRIRRYGSKKGLTDTCFVEIKTKTEYEKISSKYRFMCPYPLIPDLFDGKDIKGRIAEMNSDVYQFDILYKHVRRMIIEQGFRPLLRSHHARAYFQVTEEDPIRCTLDGFVKFTYLPDMRSFTEGFRLFETKLRAGADLEKMDDLLMAIDAQRVWRFSKFHRALKRFEPNLLERINSMLCD